MPEISSEHGSETRSWFRVCGQKPKASNAKGAKGEKQFSWIRFKISPSPGVRTERGESRSR